MKAALLAAIAAVVALSLRRWRWGLLLVPLVGFAQDPVRKMLPGRPVAIVVVVAGVVGICLLAALLGGQMRWLSTALAAYGEIRTPLFLFAAVVAIQAARTVISYGNQTMAAIGLLGYLSPVIGIGAFYLLASRWPDARRWLAVYVACAVFAGATVVVHFLGVESPLFESIALDTVYGLGGRVQMYCGILRGSELAAFHSATAACVVLAWAAGTRRVRALVPAGLLVALLFTAVLLSGRRKMLAQMGLFVVVFLFLEARARGRRGRLLTAVAALGIAAGVLAAVAADPETGSGLQPYIVRGTSVVGDSVERLTSMTTGALGSVYANVGFFGAGAGVASQGSQYEARSGPALWANSEGGLGRVMMELGVPGLVLLAALAWASVVALRRVTRFAAHLDSPDSHLVLGLAAILPSNAAVFVSAQQLYGDPFVLVVLGAFYGLALGYPPAMALRSRSGVSGEAARPTGAARGPGTLRPGGLAPAAGGP